MRRKIILSLTLLFACSASGAGMAVLYVKSTTAELARLAELHRIDDMRQHLIIAIQAAQSDLYTVNTSLAQTADVIVENISGLEQAAAKCTGCHHEPGIAGRIERIQARIGDYETALSYYMTASTNSGRIARLRGDAAVIGNDLLATTSDMSIEASKRVETRTAAALERFDEARVILTVTLLVTFLVGAAIAVHLTSSMTRPIGVLVKATRAIAAGDLNYSISISDRDEFGELAKHFNTMSAALRDGYAALQAQIEERKNAEAQLLYDAFHDALTGLPNRALFLDRLEHVITTGKRSPDLVYAVVFLDLDRFKVINDTLGHLVGDHVLVVVGERISACLRPGDTVARLGGDEFGVLLEGIKGTTDAQQIGDRIQTSLHEAIDVDGHEVFVTASIGMALRSDRYHRPEQLLRDADIAMYQAKLKGKACSEVFDAEMHGSVVDRLELEADLRRAVEHGNEFLLHFQPIVALRTNRLIGLEALVRWSHPVRGLLQASDFVSLADESGMIVPIGEWAIRSACAQLHTWQERVPALAGVTMSVNVSGRQFRRPDIIDNLRSIVRESGVDPRLVAIEVTEGVIMDDVEASAAKLALLRDMGIQIHVDDFGTGYSSLSYLHRFPITAVKIDRSFVAGLPSHPESEEVIKAIVSIAESLDFDVIAEGVEGEPHVARLEELRCRYGQGMFLSPPMPVEEVEAWVVGRPRSVA